MAGAPQLPPDPLATFARRVGAARPTAPARLVRVGVVLAAGRSERLDPLTRGGSKALLRLGGLSLAERAVRTLLAYGLERVVVVVGHDAGPVAAVVGRLGRGRVQAVYADRWRDGNGASLAAVEDAVAGEPLFMLLTTDHLFGEGALDRLLGAGAPAVLVDPAPDRAAWQEGCKVRIVDEAAVAFGKHLDEPAIDCGAFLLPPRGVRQPARGGRRGRPQPGRCGDLPARARPLRAVPLPAGCWWQDVDTPQDARAAVAALRRSLGKDTDGPVSRFVNRPLSTRLSMALAPLRPAPDLVSLVAFALGVAGAVLLAAGQGLAGALLVHAASVADGVDGEVARLQVRAGRGGRCWTGCWTGSPTPASWPALGCGR
jgi:choline kinase